jgi:AraC-like DNA-binding protein
MPQDVEIQAFDPLSQALNALGLRAKLMARVEANGQWGIEFTDGYPSFHCVLAGRACIQLNDGRFVELMQGDIIFVLDGKRHSISSKAGRKTVPLARLITTRWKADRCVLKLRADDKSAQTVLACGNFDAEQETIKSLLGNIPNPLVLKKSDFTSFDAVGATLSLVEFEARPARPGVSIVCARLVELLLIYGMRRLIESSQVGTDSWLRGLLDPAISQALTLIHGELARQWTVSELAAEVSMSRSAFAARFVRFVGETPAKHLVRWRMQSAKDLLIRGSTISQAARRCGYESDSAFSRAFAREIGHPPTYFKPQKLH